MIHASQQTALDQLPEQADLIIDSRWICPVVPERALYENHSLIVADGRIAAIVPQQTAAARYPEHPRSESAKAPRRLRLKEQLLLPALINAHCHLSMNLFRGLADDLPLQVWLEEHIWPAEGRWVSPEFVADGAQNALYELAASGAGCVADMYFFPDIVADALQRHGMKGQLACPVFSLKSAWGDGEDDYIDKALQLFAARHGEKTRIAFGPHAPYSVSAKALKRIARERAALDAAVHIHAHETRAEVRAAEAADGCRPLRRLANLGLANPRLQCVHMVVANDEDIAILRDSGAHVVHCPESNMKLGSGIAPVAKLLDAGVNVALGTDSAASNNNLDLLGEMRSAALLAKARDEDASALPAWRALEMATINGARALGLENESGSLEVGKAADLLAVDLSAPDMQPVYDPISSLIYSAGRERFSWLWIDGKPLLAEGRPQGFDEAQLIEASRRWRHKIAAQRTA